MKRFKYLTLAALIVIAACATDLRAAEKPIQSCNVAEAVAESFFDLMVIELLLLIGQDDMAFEVAYVAVQDWCPSLTDSEIDAAAAYIVAYVRVT